MTSSTLLALLCASSYFSAACVQFLESEIILIYRICPNFDLALDADNDILESLEDDEAEAEANDTLLLNPQDKANSYGDLVEPLKSAGLKDFIDVIGGDSDGSLKFAKVLDEFANRKGGRSLSL